jgi:hypothetical protein
VTNKTGSDSEDQESDLSKAADRIRKSAQYILAAFAAVGAVLAAGLQIGNLGGVSFEADWLRAVLALAGVLVAVVGISLAIAAAARVSPASYVDLNWLIEHPRSEAWHVVDEDSGLRHGKDLVALRAQIDAAAQEASTTYEEIVELGGSPDPGDQQTAQARKEPYEAQLATLDYLQSIRTRVLDVASFIRTKTAYDNAKIWIVVGAFVAAIGISGFAWGANAPKLSQAKPASVRWETMDGQTAAVISGVANLNLGTSARLEVRGFPNPTQLYSSVAVPTSPNSTTFDVTVIVPPQYTQIVVWMGAGSSPHSCAPGQNLPAGCSVVNVVGSSRSAPIFDIAESNGVLSGTVTMSGLISSGHVQTRVVGFHRNGSSDVLIQSTGGVGGQGVAIGKFSIPAPAGYLYVVIGSGSPVAPSCLPDSTEVGCYTYLIPGDP